MHHPNRKIECKCKCQYLVTTNKGGKPYSRIKI